MGNEIIYNAKTPDLVTEHANNHTAHHHHVENFNDDACQDWRNILGDERWFQYAQLTAKKTGRTEPRYFELKDDIQKDQTNRLHACHAYWSTLAAHEIDPSRKAFAKMQEEMDKRLLANVEPEPVEQTPAPKKFCTIV